MATSVKLLLKNKPRSDFTYPIVLQVIKDGKAKVISTGISCNKSDWIGQELKKTHPNFQKRNLILMNIKQRALKIIDDFIEEGIDFTLNDFEKLSQKYWELEMDADRFGKEMIAKLIIKLGLPIDVAKENLGLSRYIENYPLTSNMVLSQLKMIIDSIKQIKKSGGEYTDIQDHPMIKRHLDKLENFI